MFILWFSGFRGAMAFALSIESIFLLPDKDTHHISSRIFSLVLWISIITIMLQSPFIEPIVYKFNLIEQHVSKVHEEDRSPDKGERKANPTKLDKVKDRISEIMYGVFTKNNSVQILQANVDRLSGKI